MISKINLSPAVRHYQQKAVSFKEKPADDIQPIQIPELEQMDHWSLSDLKNDMYQRMKAVDVKMPPEKHFNATNRGSSIQYSSEYAFFVKAMKLLYNRVIGLMEENQKLESQKSELIGMLGYDPFQFAK